MGAKSITEIRNRLDSIDEELCRKIAARMKAVHEVAEFKKSQGMSRKQPEREQEVIKKARKLAEEMDLNPDAIEEIMRILIKEAHSRESEILDN